MHFRQSLVVVLLALPLATVAAERRDDVLEGLPQAGSGTADSSPVTAQSVGPRKDAAAPAAEQVDQSQLVYEEAMRNLIPVAPDHVRDLRSRQDSIDAAVHGGPLPRLDNREVRLEIGPGMPAPEIALAPGFVSSILFVDSTGSPWPIRWLTGDTSGTRFSLSWIDELPANLITVKPMMNHISGNLVVTLDGLDMPINVLLDADSRNKHGLHTPEADGTVTIKVMRSGPNAATPTVVSSPVANINSVEHLFLYETPPADAEEIELQPAVGRAWLHQGSIYYRAEANLAWPAYVGLVNGQSGVKVYKLGLVPSLLVSKGGQKITVMLDTTKTKLSGVNYGG